MTKLLNKDMQLIYDVSKRVFNKEISSKEACMYLDRKTPSAQSSLLMYFYIYKCLRNGTCYKMGTSAAFTRYMIEHIYIENGENAMITALSSAKQNAEFRKSCNNEQPGIERTCRELIKEYNLNVTYEELSGYKQLRPHRIAEPMIDYDNSTVKYPRLRVTISIGQYKFEAEGIPEEVRKEEDLFYQRVVFREKSDVNTIKTLHSKTKSIRKSSNDLPRTGVTIDEFVSRNKNLFEYLKGKIDFKAKMIPLLYIAGKDGFEIEFTVADIQKLMYDSIGYLASKSEITDIFKRRSDWFEIFNTKPKRYKLLDTAEDYARNILQNR